MHTVSFEYAQSHLLELLDEVARGEAVEIARPDSSVVVLMARPAVSEAKEIEAATATSAGWPWADRWKGKVVLHEGWDAPIPEEDWEVLRE